MPPIRLPTPAASNPITTTSPGQGLGKHVTPTDDSDNSQAKEVISHCLTFYLYYHAALSANLRESDGRSLIGRRRFINEFISSCGPAAK